MQITLVLHDDIFIGELMNTNDLRSKLVKSENNITTKQPRYIKIQDLTEMLEFRDHLDKK